MKKLILTVAIICTAVIGQTAQVDWQAARNFIKDHDGNAMKSANVYLVLATEGTAYTALQAGLADGSITAGNISENSLYLGSGVTASNNGSLATISSLDKSALVANGNAYKLVFVAFETYDAKQYYYLSSVAEAAAWDDATEYTHDLSSPANWAGSTYSADRWHEVESIPEPTTGLLVLLGVAGLTLRRRRA